MMHQLLSPAEAKKFIRDLQRAAQPKEKKRATSTK